MQLEFGQASQCDSINQLKASHMSTILRQIVVDGLSNMVKSSFNGSRSAALIGLLSLGAVSNAFGDTAEGVVSLGLENGDRADQAKISFIRQTAPYDTTSFITNGTGNVLVELELDQGTSIGEQYEIAPQRIMVGTNPAWDRHHVFVTDERIAATRGEGATARVYNLLGQQVDELQLVGFEDGIATYEWSRAGRFAEGVYLAMVNGKSSKLLHMGKRQSHPTLTPHIRTALAKATPQPQINRKESPMQTSSSHLQHSALAGVLLSLGAVSNAFGDTADVFLDMTLSTGQAADNAKVSFIRQTSPYDTTFAILDNGGSMLFQVELDQGTSIGEQYELAPQGIVVGTNPSWHNHHVHATSRNINLTQGRNVEASVYNLLGQKVADMDLVGFENGIGTYEWSNSSMFAEGVYIANVNGQTTKMLHMGGRSSIPELNQTILRALNSDVQLQTSNEVSKDRKHAVDDYVATPFRVVIEPTDDTDNPFNTDIDEIEINSLNFQYIRNDLEPLTSQTVMGSVMSLETLGMNPDTESLENVLVQYYEEAGENFILRGETTTDQNGNYVLDAQMDGNFDLDGFIVFSKDGFMTSARAVNHSYSSQPLMFPIDDTNYQNPHDDPHTQLLVHDEYWDEISGQYVDFNWNYFDDMWLIFEAQKDGVISAMNFRDELNHFSIRLSDNVSEWTKENYLVPALGSLDADDPVDPLSFEGMFGEMFTRVYTEREGLDAEGILAYNGFTTDDYASEGAYIFIGSQNFASPVANQVFGHVIGGTIQYSTNTPSLRVAVKEVLRLLGVDFDGVSYSPSNMLQSSTSTVRDVGNFVDRINIGTKLASDNVTYAQGLATPGTLYSIELGQDF